jgi:toxin FitB
VSFLLDTNTISEWQKPQPNPGVIAWMRVADEEELFLSVATLAELRYGVERMSPGKRRIQLEQWLDYEVPQRFEGRILPVNMQIANAWGRLVAHRDSSGRPISAIDAFLAATAEVHSLTLVTRNVDDFVGAGDVLCPWT